MKRFQIVFLLLFCLVVANLLRCSQNVAGGGSESGNPVVIGEIVDENGKPAANTRVLLISHDFNPVTDTLYRSHVDTTNSLGVYRFHNIDTGACNIEAVHMNNGKKVLQTGIQVIEDTVIVPQATLKDPGVIKMFLPDTIDTVNGYVYIEGTTVYEYLTEAVSDSNGLSIIIDSVPAADVPHIYYDRLNNPPEAILLSEPSTVIPNDTTAIDPFVSWVQYTTANSGLPQNRADEVYVCFSSFSWMQDSISIWITTNTAGIAVFNKSTWRIYDQSTSSIPSELITQVIRYDNEDWVWVSSVHGFFKFDGSDWQVWDASNGLPANLVSCMAFTSNGDIWAGMYPGIGFFDKGSEQWTVYDTAVTGLESHYIEDVAVDKNDNPWVMTSNGAGFFNGSSWQVYTEASGLLSDSTHCVVVDSMDNVWIGHEDGGLSRYDGNQWTTFTTADSKILNSIVRDIVPDKNNNIWIGTGTGITMFDGTEWKDFDGERYAFLENKSIRSLFIDNEGAIWVGTNASGVIKFKTTVKLGKKI